MSLLMVGAGGHARAIAEVLAAARKPIDLYIDPKVSDWLSARRLPTESDVDDLPPGEFVLGLGGMTPDQLSKRVELFRAYRKRGWKPRTVVHESAIVSNSATIGGGCILLALSVAQPAAQLGDAVIVNTGAIVEHDSIVGDGTHVAPAAVVLGGCKVGSACMIGAGAIVLPGAEVPDGTLVPAGTRFSK